MYLSNKVTLSSIPYRHSVCFFHNIYSILIKSFQLNFIKDWDCHFLFFFENEVDYSKNTIDTKNKLIGCLIKINRCGAGTSVLKTKERRLEPLQLAVCQI